MQDDESHGSVSGGAVVKKEVVNFGDSVRARLLAVAKRENVQLEYLLLRYALERFLYRLGVKAKSGKIKLVVIEE